MTTLLPNAPARATATAWRCPPDRVSTAWLMFCRVLMPRFLIWSLGVPLHLPGVEHPQHRAERALAADLAGQEQVARDVERRGDGEGLVDGLDAGVPRVLRASGSGPAAVDEDAARGRGQRSGQALDQRRLAGAVVADHREDLAGVQGQVDGVEPDDPAEELDEAASLEHRSACLRSCLHAPDPLVDGHRGDHQDADGEDLVVRVEPGQRQAVVEDLHDERADQRPTTTPRPPNRLVPPMTTAVMDSRLAFRPLFGSPPPTRPTRIQAATAIATPATM